MSDASAAAASHREELITGRGVIAGLVAMAFLTIYTLSIALVPIRADNDCWWHVKSGKVIAEEGLPEFDVLSYTASDHEWHNHEWLTQLVMWKAWETGEGMTLGGWRAVILVKSLTLCACYLTLLLLARKLSGSWWIALLLLIVAIGIGRRTFYPRPPVVSNLLLAGLLLLVTSIQEGSWKRHWLWILPPAFALWTNLHGAWMAGVVVLVAMAGQDGVAWLAQRRWKDRTPEWIEGFLSRQPVPVPLWLGVGAATFVGTLCNPYGWKLYELPARVMGDKALVSSIGELMPPDYRFAFDMPLAILLMILMAVWVLLSGKRNTFIRIGELGVFAFFLYQGAMHVRHLLLLSVMMVPLGARVLGEAFRPGTGSSPRRLAIVTVVTALWATMVLSNWPQQMSYPSRNRSYIRDRTGYEEWRYPKALCDFVELANLEGRMYNENHYAGYLIWRWSPETHRVFSDPRFDIFGGKIWREEVTVSQGFMPQPGENWYSWSDVLDKWDIQWAIVQSPLNRHDKQGRPDSEQGLLEQRMARPDSGWRLVADWSSLPRSVSGFQIWVRDTEENALMIRRALRMFQTTYGRKISP